MMRTLRDRRARRQAADDAAVLAALRAGVAYVLDMSPLLRIGPARIYLALARLEESGRIVGEFQPSVDGRPRRRAYREAS